MGRGPQSLGNAVLAKVSRFIDRLERVTLVWTILGLALIGFVQVFARYVFNYSFTWFEELGRYLGVFVAFLGGGIGVKSGSHFTMDLIVTHLNRPWRQLLQCLTSVLSGLFFVIVAFYSWKIVLRMYGYGTTSAAMEIPMYLAYLPIPIFSMVMGFRFFAVGARFLREIIHGSKRSSGEVSP